jgi:hypothetical protein
VNDLTTDGYIGRENETTSGDHFNALSFLINQIISGKWTLTLGLVKSVTGGGVGPAPTVSVQPMVNQTDGQGNPTPHGIINNVPAFRLQGGSGAFIADPVIGDIGLLAFAMSDISAVKKTLAPANPGSFRTFSPSDAMYFGALLGSTPTQYVQITPQGITIQFAAGISITLASTGITLQAGSAAILIATDGTITINGIVWDTHIHTVTTAPGVTGVPEA